MRFILFSDGTFALFHYLWMVCFEYLTNRRHTKYDLPKHQRIIFLFVVEMVSSDLGLSLRQYSFHPYIESFVSTLSRSLEDLLTCAFNDVLLFPLCFHSRLVIDDRLCFTTWYFYLLLSQGKILYDPRCLGVHPKRLTGARYPPLELWPHHHPARG